MKIQKSFLGASAAQIVKTARVEEMRAGNMEVVVSVRGRDYLALSTDSGDLALRESCGLAAVVELDAALLERIEALEAAAYA